MNRLDKGVVDLMGSEMKKEVEARLAENEQQSQYAEGDAYEDVSEVNDQLIADEKPAQEMIELPLDDVNNFMSIVDVVLVDDVRSAVIIKHFTKMLIKHNPKLSQG